MTDSRPRIAWFSGETPSPDGNGGQRRQFHQVLALIQLGFDVRVAVADSAQDRTALEAVLPVEAVPFRRGSRRTTARVRLGRWLTRTRPDALVIAHIESLRLIEGALQRRNVPWVLDLHNVNSRWAAVQGDENGREMWAHREAAILRSAAGVTCCSEAEAAFLPDTPGACPVAVAPHGVAPAEWPDAAIGERRRDVVMFGSWEHGPNAEAVGWFVRHAWGTVTEAVPDARLLLAGPGRLPAAVSSAPGAVALGRVDDLARLLGAARVTVVPLVLGAGARMKFPEALASGAAVVSTALGAEGGEAARGTFALADEPGAFADACVRLLTHPDVAEELGRAGRSHALRAMTWGATTQPLGDLLSTVAARGRSR